MDRRQHPLAARQEREAVPRLPPLPCRPAAPGLSAQVSRRASAQARVSALFEQGLPAMSIKEKILEVLDCALDDLSEERLLEILLDAYQGKKRTIANLEHECSAVRQQLHDEKERIRDEHKRIRSDPLYTAPGEYFFYYEWTAGLDRHKQRLGVRIVGRSIEMFERQKGYDVAIMQVSREEFIK
jgi:hypothetical protein